MNTACCLWCGEIFRPVPKVNERFCSPECSRDAYYRRLLFHDIPVELESQPIRAVTNNVETSSFLASAVEFMAVKAEVILALEDYLTIDRAQMADAEAMRTTVWRYWSKEEEELRSRWIALRSLTDDWHDYV